MCILLLYAWLCAYDAYTYVCLRVLHAVSYHMLCDPLKVLRMEAQEPVHVIGAWESIQIRCDSCGSRLVGQCKWRARE